MSYHYEKESKPRRPVTADHPIVAAARRVLEQCGGGPLTSKEIFDRAVAQGWLDEGQYNSLRSRLSQHCDLEDAIIVRKRGSKVGVRGARTTAWVLRSSRRGIAPAAARRRRKARHRRRRRKEAQAKARDLVLAGDALEGAPPEAKDLEGQTARDALLSDADPDTVKWLLENLPLQPEFRARLEKVAADQAKRRSIIDAEEKRRA